MKKILFLSPVLLAVSFLFGQANEGLVTYQNKQQPAAVISLPYSVEMINMVMSDYLSKKGSKASDIKGFKTYRNTRLMDNDSTSADLYFKINPANTKDKVQSTVYLMVGVPNEDVANRNPGAQFNMEQAKTFLNNLSPVMESYKLEIQIRDQNDLVIREEKKSKSLTDDGLDLSKKKFDLDRKLDGNKQDQEKQNTEVEKQKQALALLINQRKS
jgi:hypothetical protein